MTTDTPRTDAAIWRLTTFSSALLEHDGETCNEIYCVSQDEAECLVDLLNKKELELAISLENQCKAQAEVERLKAQLSRAVTIGEALSSELVFPDFVNELNSLKASLSETNSLQPSA
jgi:hypothetical protein